MIASSIRLCSSSVAVARDACVNSVVTFAADSNCSCKVLCSCSPSRANALELALSRVFSVVASLCILSCASLSWVSSPYLEGVGVGAVGAQHYACLLNNNPTQPTHNVHDLAMRLLELGHRRRSVVRLMLLPPHRFTHASIVPLSRLFELGAVPLPGLLHRGVVAVLLLKHGFGSG